MNSYLHHAHVLEAESDIAHMVAKEHIKKHFELEITGNPDVEIIETEKFSIEQARQLKSRAYQSALHEKQVFILICSTILREAQNALLKLLEEPSAGTYFVIIIPSVHKLLPTVRSRLSFHTHHKTITKINDDAYIFETATIRERIEMMQPFIKDKDREGAQKFLNALEYHYYSKPEKNFSALQEVSYAQKYLNDTSSSLKMLLEHVAITT